MPIAPRPNSTGVPSSPRIEYYVCGFVEAAFELGLILESLDAKHGLFGVLGNHDHFRGSRIVQEGLPDVIPVEVCYLGWQESLTLLAKLVEPEIPD